MNGKFIAPERRLAQGACKNTNYNRHQQPHRTTYNNMKQHGWITVSKFFYPTNTTYKFVDTPSYYLHQGGYVITSIYPSSLFVYL